MLISVQNFSGIAPRIAATALAPNQAQTAMNTRLVAGVLEGLFGSTPITTLSTSGQPIRKLHLKSNNPNAATQWVWYPYFMDYQVSPLANDVHGRLYVTSERNPVNTTKPFIANVTSSGGWSLMGVAAPTTSAKATISGDAQLAGPATGSFGQADLDAVKSAGGTITVAVDGGTAHTLTVNSSTTLTILAAQFNSFGGMTATVVGGSITLKSLSEGANASIVITRTVQQITYDGALGGTPQVVNAGASITLTSSAVFSAYVQNEKIVVEYLTNGNVDKSEEKKLVSLDATSPNYMLAALVELYGSIPGITYGAAVGGSVTLTYTATPGKSLRLTGYKPTYKNVNTELASVRGIDGTEVLESRVYVYTNVRKAPPYEEESSPSPVTVCDDMTASQTVTLTGFDHGADGGYGITHRRIYRTSTGSQGTNYYLVDEQPYSSVTFIDTKKAEELQEALPSLEWTEPPEGLTGIVSVPGGVFVAFKGRDIYFSEPYRPHAWPEKYSQTCPYNVVGLGVFGTSVLVCTDGSPSLITGANDPAGCVMTKLDIEQSCLQKNSIVSLGNGVVYASPDGLIYVGTGSSDILTKLYLSARELQGFCDPGSLMAVAHDGRYYGFHSKGGFIFDPSDTTGALTLHDTVVDAVYSDLRTDRVYIVPKGTTDIKAFGYSLSPMTYHWKSKRFQLTYDHNLAAAQVLADQNEEGGYDDVHFRMVVDGNQVYPSLIYKFTPVAGSFRTSDCSFEIEEWLPESAAAGAVGLIITQPSMAGFSAIVASYTRVVGTAANGRYRFTLREVHGYADYVPSEAHLLGVFEPVLNSRPFRLPSGYRGRWVEFEVYGTTPISQVNIASSMQELQNV